MNDSANSSRRISLKTWIALGLVIVALSSLCVSLGFWQWHRHEARSARIAQVLWAYNAPVVEITEFLDQDRNLTANNQWRPATAQGRFVGSPVLVRNRPVGLGSGFHVLSIFQLDSGGKLVVNRGYLPTKLDAKLLDISEPPTSEVTIVGRLRLAEAPERRGVIGNQVYTFSPTQVMQAAGLDPNDDSLITSGYLVLDDSQHEFMSGLVALPAPDTTMGSHFSYAIQWWIFAAGFVTLFLVLLLREFRSRPLTLDDLIDDQPQGSQTGASRRAKQRKATAEIDNEAEDMQIAQQLE